MRIPKKTYKSWQTKHRGELLIHAGKGIDKETMKKLAKYIKEDIPTGKILGKVRLVNCIKRKKLLKWKTKIWKKAKICLNELIETLENWINALK